MASIVLCPAADGSLLLKDGPNLATAGRGEHAVNPPASAGLGLSCHFAAADNSVHRLDRLKFFCRDHGEKIAIADSRYDIRHLTGIGASPASCRPPSYWRSIRRRARYVRSTKKLPVSSR